MTRPPPNDIQLYGAHLHPVTLPHGRNRKRPLSSLPATVIDAPRRSWCEDVAAVMEVKLKRLICDEVVEINGVKVQRTDAFGRLTFHVNDERSANGTPIRYTLAAAIDRVLAIGGGGAMGKPTLISLFAGIGLNNSTNQWDCSFYIQQFLSFDYASMNQSMTIRAKNNPILNGQFPPGCFGLNVMGIATRFIPSANHAFIRIQPSHGFVPPTFIGINTITTMNVGYPTIPNHGRAVLTEIFKSSLFLLISHLSVLMTSQVKLLSAFFIIFWAHCSASASARNHFHSVSSFPSLGEKIISHLSPNKYPELREK